MLTSLALGETWEEAFPPGVVLTAMHAVAATSSICFSWPSRTQCGAVPQVIEDGRPAVQGTRAFAAGTAQSDGMGANFLPAKSFRAWAGVWFCRSSADRAHGSFSQPEFRFPPQCRRTALKDSPRKDHRRLELSLLDYAQRMPLLRRQDAWRKRDRACGCERSIKWPCRRRKWLCNTCVGRRRLAGNQNDEGSKNTAARSGG